MTPFAATVRSEWTKLSSLRSTKVMLACSLIFALALTALLALVVGNTWDDWKPADRRDYEPIGAALVGMLASAIFFLVIGVKAATAEYGAGMMRLTLTATPRRGRVLAAKALVVSAVTIVAGLVCNVAMYLLAKAILSSYGIDTPSLTDSDVVRAVLGSAALTPLFPIIGLALGITLRSTAATIIAVLAVIFVPPFVGGLVAGRRARVRADGRRGRDLDRPPAGLGRGPLPRARRARRRRLAGGLPRRRVGDVRTTRRLNAIRA